MVSPPRFLIGKDNPLRISASRVVDLRGNSYDRRRRRAWMVKEFGKDCVACINKPMLAKMACLDCGGRGRVMQCYWCRAILMIDEFEVDRHPVCGHNGGRYVKGNIVPACRSCNVSRCNEKDAICIYGQREVVPA